MSSNVTCESYGAYKSTYGGQTKISDKNEHVTEISTYYNSGPSPCQRPLFGRNGHVGPDTKCIDKQVEEEEGMCDCWVTSLLNLMIIKVKVKESRNRTGVAQRVPGGLCSQIFMTFGT
jgi:hypothetical protein